MKILVISRHALDETNSIGNTISNFFSGISDVKFANIFFRSGKPNNTFCEEYYQVTEKDVIKHWLSPRKIGRQFHIGYQCDIVRGKDIDEKMIAMIHNYNISLAHRVSECVWESKRWINRNLRKFVESFSPDLIFSFVKAAPQYYLTIKFLREEYNIPLLSWIADDEYTGYLQNNSISKINNLKYILAESSCVIGCSKEICNYYNLNFGCNATPLYKGCDFVNAVRTTPMHDSISIVYAGNLLYGRFNVIDTVSACIEEYSAQKKMDICFEIYSNTEISNSRIHNHFGNKCCTKYMGKCDYGIIKNRLSTADVVLYVESFEKEEILKTKYSFSTKIADYLQCGSSILAIGPGELASIKYFKQIQGVCVIDKPVSVKDELFAFLNDYNEFGHRASQIREFAMAYHDSKKVRLKLRNLISALKRSDEQ